MTASRNPFRFRGASTCPALVQPALPGEVREEGAHDQLLEQDGLYARPYELQFASAAG